MKRLINDENGDTKRSFLKHDGVSYAYEVPYVGYADTTTTVAPTSVSQPLPGQPPLPPMPPPSTAPGPPPPPHVYPHGQIPCASPVQTWVQESPSPIQTWVHAPPPPPPWQWITQTAQTSQTLPPHSSRDIVNVAFQREIQPLRGNYVRRERFNQNRNANYNLQRSNNFHRKNRRLARYDQAQSQFAEQTGYFGNATTATTALPGAIAVMADWQRNAFTNAANEALVNHMPVSISNQQNRRLSEVRRSEDGNSEQDVKVLSEDMVVKKNKQRRPMSQSYPSRPWKREDAEKALKVENEYNKTIKSQSLIIKFPDPDLNKEIVRDFHSGIQNIHFQSPSGPRYCFIQMSENVNIDEAIKELEKIKFGIGYLKVERKSLRDEDNPMPEEIDPYTLYIGNLPESVNVNEVKSKFPTASRVDVGYAQKMRNTRYAFIRYNSVDESIAAYKQSHDLMWDTRSIIVRFRRQRGNTCLPGETKVNTKKAKENSAKPAKANTTEKKNECNENTAKNERLEHETNDGSDTKLCDAQQENNVTSTDMTQLQSKSNAVTKTTQQQAPQPWTTQPSEIPSGAEAPPLPVQDKNTVEKMDLLMEIKEEPIDYDELEDNEEEDDDDDDDDDDDEDDDDDDSNKAYDVEETEELHEEDDENDENEDINIFSNRRKSHDEIVKKTETKDHLDEMFNDLDNAVDDIEW